MCSTRGDLTKTDKEHLTLLSYIVVAAAGAVRWTGVCFRVRTCLSMLLINDIGCVAD